MRERALCKFYIAHHQCQKGKQAETLGLCQKCSKWESARRPVRKDKRKAEREKFMKDKRNWED